MERSPRILLVDDEKRLAESFARLLSRRGFQSTPVFSGEDALRAIDSYGPFDAVVLDLNMPGLDGIGTLKKIKARWPETGVIVLTGHASLETGVEAIREGAFDYLFKPAHIEELVEKIDEVLRLENIRRKPRLWTGNRVRDIIRNPLRRLHPDDPVEMARDLYRSAEVDMAGEVLFLFDRRDRLAGYVTRADLDREAGHKSLVEVMHSDTIIAHPEEGLTDVSRRMIANNFRSLPVVDDGRVLGIVRLADVLAHLDGETE